MLPSLSGMSVMLRMLESDIVCLPMAIVRIQPVKRTVLHYLRMASIYRHEYLHDEVFLGPKMLLTSDNFRTGARASSERCMSKAVSYPSPDDIKESIDQDSSITF